MLLLTCCAKTCCSDSTKTCPVCKQRFDDATSFESHRPNCFSNNRLFFEGLPSALGSTCPLCQGSLKRWPRFNGLDNGFRCQAGNPPCPTSREENPTIVNNGSNRFSCYLCSYDICEACLQRRQLGERNRLLAAPRTANPAPAPAPVPAPAPAAPVPTFVSMENPPSYDEALKINREDFDIV